MLTSGISAEYGRFSGGVINVVTKSGGDQFSGTFRANLANDNWQDAVAVRGSHATSTSSDKLNPVYEGTFGGPILQVASCGSSPRAAILSTENQTTLAGTGPAVRRARTRRSAARSRSPSRSRTTTPSRAPTRTVRTRRRATGLGISGRPARRREPELPERRLHRQLPRRAERQAVRRPALLAEDVRLPRRRRHADRTCQRLAVHQPEHAVGALQRAVLRRDRPGGSQQLPGRRQPVVRPDHAELRHPRLQGRLRGVQQHAHRRQLAVADQLRVQHRLPRPDPQPRCSTRRGASSRCSCPGETLLENYIPTRGAQVDTRTLSFYIQDQWRLGPPLDVRSRRALREGRRRGDRRHHHRGHERVRAAPGRVVRHLRRRPHASRRPPTRGTPASTASRSSPATPTVGNPTYILQRVRTARRGRASTSPPA